MNISIAIFLYYHRCFVSLKHWANKKKIYLRITKGIFLLNRWIKFLIINKIHYIGDYMYILLHIKTIFSHIGVKTQLCYFTLATLKQILCYQIKNDVFVYTSIFTAISTLYASGRVVTNDGYNASRGEILV